MEAKNVVTNTIFGRKTVDLLFWDKIFYSLFTDL